MKKKRNCWETKKCGRELGGEKAYKTGVCPAATNIMLDGIHGGTNAGRACWVVAGTMCDGDVSGTFANKTKDCGICEFYALVKDEEGKEFVPTSVILSRLKCDIELSDSIQKRLEFRFDTHHMVEYTLDPDTPHHAMKGVTVNLSSSGLCLVVFTPLQKGQKIIITSGLRVTKPATVCWAKKLDDHIYKVGLVIGE